MDLIDRKILDLLQRDATLSIAEIADRVGLSQTPCWKRIQRLETQGIVEKRVALLNPEKLGLGLTVFVSIETNDHSQAWLARFADLVTAMPANPGVNPALTITALAEYAMEQVPVSIGKKAGMPAIVPCNPSS